MFENLAGKTVVITGGAGGIGKATAKLLGGLGMKVFIVDITDEIIQKALDEFKEFGFEASGKACNISDEASVAEVVKACKDAFGPAYALVNCAGIYKDCYFKDMDFKTWNQTLDINLNGTFNVIKAFSEDMIEAKCGNIVSLTSQAGISGSVMHAHYSASKAGIIGLTTTLARELAEYNIRVNCIAPGIIKTAMTSHYSPERQEMFYRQIPLRRFGEPSEVASVVLFCISELSSYMTGQTFPVTGGWLLHS